MDYSIAPEPQASGHCLGCGITIVGPGFSLGHVSGRRALSYCSRACAEQDAAADVLADGFEDEDIDPIDEPR